MNFVTNILNSIVDFFNTYNFNSLFWCIHDNYLPTSLHKFVDLSLSFFSIFIEKVCLVYISLNEILLSSLESSELLISLGFTTVMINALATALKFLACIALLIFARGGIPRFRFDYLTKLGWIRFLSLVLLSLLIEILLLSLI